MGSSKDFRANQQLNAEFEGVTRFWIYLHEGGECLPSRLPLQRPVIALKMQSVRADVDLQLSRESDVFELSNGRLSFVVRPFPYDMIMSMGKAVIVALPSFFASAKAARQRDRTTRSRILIALKYYV